MRSVLIATPTFEPDLNGVAVASSACARALLDDGWRVHVAAPPSAIPRTSFDCSGISVHEFGIQESPGPLRRASVAKYHALLTEQPWDAIVFQGYSWPLMLALPLLPSLKAKKILFSHGYAAARWFPVARFPFGLGQWLRSLMAAGKMLHWCRHVDRWVFLSCQRDFGAFFDRQIARIARHPGQRVIPNGVEPPVPSVNERGFRDKHGIPASACFFLCVAYYSRGKDQGFAVRAFRKAKIPDSVLVFIGTEFNEWSDKYRKLDAFPGAGIAQGRVLWLENITRSETLSAFAECNAFVLPSHLETQPISILESMANGKPWIARKTGCIARLPGGICVRSVSSMANAMSAMAASRSIRTDLGEQGRHAAKSIYSRKAFSESCRQLLNELVPSKH